MPGPRPGGPQCWPSRSPPPLGSSGTASPPGGGRAGDRGKDWPSRSPPYSPLHTPALHEGTDVTSSVGHWAPRARERVQSRLRRVAMLGLEPLRGEAWEAVTGPW